MRFVTYQPNCIYPDVPEIDLDTYFKGLSNFISLFLEDYKGDVAFYQFGKIRTPGVSDIDLLIIVEDEAWSISRQKAQSLIESDGLLRFLFVHEPVVVGKSLLPYISFIHTLENCTFIQGTYEPLAEIIEHSKERSSSLMLHATWNSFMRIAASELDRSSIGLRRALALMHNLLASAQNGNQFISNPIAIPFSTEEVRRTILSAAIEKQEFLARAYLEDTIAVLNNVDQNIDKELNIDSRVTSFPPIALNNIFLVDNSYRLRSKSSTSRKIINGKNIKLFRVPNYLIYMVSMIASQAEGKILSLNYFLRKFCNPSIEKEFDITQYLQNLTKTINICDRYGIDYFFPLPFGYKINKPSLKSKINLVIREKKSQLLLDYYSR